MSAKRSSASDKAHHVTYKAQQLWSRNRRIKLERALKNAPNNLQIVAALKNISYRRKTPKTREWCHVDKYMAHVIKQISGFCDKNIFHSNKDLRSAAFTNIASKREKVSTSPNFNSKSMYTMKERAHTGKGELVWA